MTVNQLDLQRVGGMRRKAKLLIWTILELIRVKSAEFGLVPERMVILFERIMT